MNRFMYGMDNNEQNQHNRSEKHIILMCVKLIQSSLYSKNAKQIFGHFLHFIQANEFVFEKFGNTNRVLVVYIYITLPSSLSVSMMIFSCCQTLAFFLDKFILRVFIFHTESFIAIINFIYLSKWNWKKSNDKNRRSKTAAPKLRT